MYKIIFYVPESHVETVKNALFDKGAGKVGHYDRCAWQTEGTGQFRPLPESNPYLGEEGKAETVREIKVEMLCEDTLIKSALEALIQTHPYETPAYSAWKIETLDDFHA